MDKLFEFGYAQDPPELKCFLTQGPREECLNWTWPLEGSFFILNGAHRALVETIAVHFPNPKKIPGPIGVDILNKSYADLPVVGCKDWVGGAFYPIREELFPGFPGKMVIYKCRFPLSGACRMEIRNAKGKIYIGGIFFRPLS